MSGHHNVSHMCYLVLLVTNDDGRLTSDIVPVVAEPMEDASTRSVVSHASRGTDTKVALASHVALKLQMPSARVARFSACASAAAAAVLARWGVNCGRLRCLQAPVPNAGGRATWLDACMLYNHHAYSNAQAKEGEKELHVQRAHLGLRE